MKLEQKPTLRIVKPMHKNRQSFEWQYGLVRKLVLIVTVVGALWVSGHKIIRSVQLPAIAHVLATAQNGSATTGTVAAATGIYLADSPDANLERMELDNLSQTHKTLDIAMYSFTDLSLADELARLAHSGVRVRVYRDREQFEEEESRARGGRESATSILVGAGIAVRVKRSRDLMHMKSYAQDGIFLRTGSANWSPSGLKWQDNDVLYMRSPSGVQEFEAKFERMWERSDNTIVH